MNENEYLQWLTQQAPAGSDPAAWAAQQLAANPARTDLVPLGTPGGQRTLVPQADIPGLASAGRYGTAADPLTPDPSAPGRLSPLSSVKSALDTPVTMPQGGGASQAPVKPAGPLVMTLTSGSGSRTKSATTASPEIPPALLPQYRSLATTAEQQAQTTSAEKLAQVDRTATLVGQWMVDAKAAQGSASEEARKAGASWEEAGRELEQQREVMRKSTLDPDRLVRSMPSWNRAMTAISVALGGFVEGFTQGKVANAGLAILNKAIDRDLESQRDQFQRQLQDLQLTERQQRMLWEQYQVREKEKRDAALRMTQLELAKLGMESQRIDVREKTSALILGIKSSLLGTEAKATPKVTTTESRTSGGSSHQILVPKEYQTGATTAVPKEVEDRIRNLGAALAANDQIENTYRQGGVPWGGRAADKVERLRAQGAMSEARAGGSRLSPEILKTTARAYPGTYSVTESLNPLNVAQGGSSEFQMQKAASNRARLEGALADEVRRHGASALNAVTPELKARVLRAVTGGTTPSDYGRAQ